MHNGDPIILEEVGGGNQRLVAGGSLPNGSQEVVSSVEGRSFRIRVFRSCLEQQQSESLLLAGSGCTLFHTESEAYVSVATDAATGSADQSAGELTEVTELSAVACVSSIHTRN